MFRMRPVAWRAAIAVLIALLLPSVAISAEMTRGSIAGTARDTSGAVVPGATVTVINVATNAVQTVVTDAEGFYRVPALEPGRYTVTTELPSFRKRWSSAPSTCARPSRLRSTCGWSRRGWVRRFRSQPMRAPRV